MIAVIFEVELAEGRKNEYLEIAAELRPILDDIEGFISVERFQSLSNPSKVLSLSFFEDEAAIGQWRAQHEHRTAQGKGREGIFADYHLRIANVVRNYGKTNRSEVPPDSLEAHSTYSLRYR